MLEIVIEEFALTLVTFRTFRTEPLPQERGGTEAAERGRRTSVRTNAGTRDNAVEIAATGKNSNIVSWPSSPQGGCVFEHRESASQVRALVVHALVPPGPPGLDRTSGTYARS